MAFAANAQNHSIVKIANKIHEHIDTKNKLRELRLELMDIAVDLGLPRSAAEKDCIAFLDGFLAGSGCLPANRCGGDE